jgi:hypothetical protein
MKGFIEKLYGDKGYISKELFEGLLFPSDWPVKKPFPAFSVILCLIHAFYFLFTEETFRPPLQSFMASM